MIVMGGESERWGRGLSVSDICAQRDSLITLSELLASRRGGAALR